MDTVLRVENLAKRFPRFALEGISFSLERGYVMGFIGQNGAGKTTTIKCIMDLLRRDGGAIEVFGMDPRADGVSVREKIGFVYDELNVSGMLTGEDVRSFVAPLYRGWDEALFRRHAKEFDLDLGQHVEKLSRGQKVKLSLAFALSHGAELLIMDEPTSGLDPVFRAELLDILYGIIQDERKSIFFSTHITSDLEKIADHITFIDNGRLVFSDSKDAVLERFRLVRGPADSLTPQVRALCVGTRATGSGFEALTREAEEVASLVGPRAVIERASLEDIMVHTARRNAVA
jgi:ABC-2 type transport system ATP-binding protein